MIVLEWWQPTAASNPMPKRWLAWVPAMSASLPGHWVEVTIMEVGGDG